MSTMEYIQLRDDLLKRLIDTKDESILQQIKDIFKKNDKDDFFDELSEDAKKEFLVALEESDKGLGRPFREVLADL